MRHRVVLILLGGFLLLGLYFLYQNFFVGTPDPKLSPDQTLILQNFGRPDQFVITYLPVEASGSAVFSRTEVWYYRQAGKKLSFLAGNLVGSEDFNPPEISGSTKLKSEDFDFFMSPFQVKAKLSDKDFLVLDGETTANNQAVFTHENNYLTYFQTLYDSQP